MLMRAHLTLRHGGCGLHADIAADAALLAGAAKAKAAMGAAPEKCKSFVGTCDELLLLVTTHYII